MQHVVMALILTGVLIWQARTLAIVLRSRRSTRTERRSRITDMVWIAVPLVAVVFLAVRSWILVLELGAPAAADPSLAPRDHPLE
jgi:heme/copper-type cytochrome/quinol oxidase subunit 2